MVIKQQSKHQRLRKKAFLHEYSKALEHKTRKKVGPEQQHLNLILTLLWAACLIGDLPRPLPTWIILWFFENRGIAPMQRSYPLPYKVKHLTTPEMPPIFQYLTELVGADITQQQRVWGVGHQVPVLPQDLHLINLITILGLQHNSSSCREVLHNDLERVRKSNMRPCTEEQHRLLALWKIRQQMMLGYLDIPSHHLPLLFLKTLPFLLHGMTAVVDMWNSCFCHLQVTGDPLRPPALSRVL